MPLSSSPPERTARRNLTLELCKLIAACFVVFIHVPFPAPAGEWVLCLARFAVPMFFAISGWYSYGAAPNKLLHRMVRVLALELADQYDDIAAAPCYYPEIGAWMEIPSTIVTQEQVTSQEGITIENLDLVADASYSDPSWMPTCDWMVELLGH